MDLVRQAVSLVFPLTVHSPYEALANLTTPVTPVANERLFVKAVQSPIPSLWMTPRNWNTIYIHATHARNQRHAIASVSYYSPDLERKSNLLFDMDNTLLHLTIQTVSSSSTHNLPATYRFCRRLR